MTDKEVLTMAGQYGLWINGDMLEISDDGVVAFARAIEQKEREACAQLCEDHFNSDGDWCAKQIRTRRES